MLSPKFFHREGSRYFLNKIFKLGLGLGSPHHIPFLPQKGYIYHFIISKLNNEEKCLHFGTWKYLDILKNPTMGFFPHFIVSFLFWRFLGCRNISPTSSLLCQERDE
jgi:hypothetical protein